MTSTLFDKLKSRADRAAQQQTQQRPTKPRPDASAGLGLGVDTQGRPIVAGFVGGDDGPQDSVTYVRRRDEYKAPRADEPLTDAQREGLRALAILSGRKS